MTSSTNSAANASQPLHIAFGVDTNYFLGMGVAMVSVLENNRGQALIFHVLTPSISDENAARLRQLETRYGTEIKVHIIDPSIFDEFAVFPSFSQYSAAIFSRLLIAGTLQGVADKVLYLDADIVCQGSVTELMAIDIDDVVVAAVGDVGSIAEKQIASLQLSHQRYFNSGVLYINVDKWMASDVWHGAVKAILGASKKFSFPDQDALNIVLDGRVKIVPPKFNWMYDLFGETSSGKKIAKEALFIHFVGRLKPWHNWCCNPENQLFLKYKAISPWADAVLYPPKNYKEIRMYSQGLRKSGRQLQGWLWYAKFVLSKFSSK
ncbi:UDP-glucose:(glucosyl)LPS alpha-1,3-glucosyltransferase [Collimonas sp. PA-H2]|uniref:glycosyltransferase family 8 protein n=1 Tax=Collimonas sp. PA-H2 TaxID=1881062 RepID=UPI000BF35E06|nr:glycosyltransferase [Collimonas sp. PA-H2]PFH10911.1 UDP-glucose:(glucosyl)LPS alpha-1,3-glucosyltransferase [Collimonas sp. PA-H2]